MDPMNVILFKDHSKIMKNLEFSKMRLHFFMTPSEHNIAFFKKSQHFSDIRTNPAILGGGGGGGGIRWGRGEGRAETVLTFPTIKYFIKRGEY